MSALTIGVDSVFADTFSVVRTNDPLFTNTRNEINSSTSVVINGTTYKLVLRHYDYDGTHMFFWIVKPGYEATYTSYYTGPYDIGGGVDAWDMDPVAYIDPTTVIESGQQLTISYTPGTTLTTLTEIIVDGQNINLSNALTSIDIIDIASYENKVNVSYVKTNNTTTVTVSGDSGLVAGSNELTLTVSATGVSSTIYRIGLNLPIPVLDGSDTIDNYILTYYPSKFNIDISGRVTEYIKLSPDLSGVVDLTHNSISYGNLANFTGSVKDIIFGIHNYTSGADFTSYSIYMLDESKNIVRFTDGPTLTLTNLGTANVSLNLRNTFNGPFAFKNNLIYENGSHTGDFFESGEIRIMNENTLSSDTSLSTFTINDNNVSNGDVIQLDNGTTSVSVVASPSVIAATVDISGASNLITGPNNLIVTVTAEDGTVQTNTVILKVASIVVDISTFETSPQEIADDVPFNVSINSQTFEFNKSTPTSDGGSLSVSSTVDGRSLSVTNLPAGASSVIIGTNNNENTDSYVIKVVILDSSGNKIEDLSNNPITLTLYFPGETRENMPIYTQQTLDAEPTFMGFATSLGNGAFRFIANHLTFFSTKETISVVKRGIINSQNPMGPYPNTNIKHHRSCMDLSGNIYTAVDSGRSVYNSTTKRRTYFINYVIRKFENNGNLIKYNDYEINSDAEFDLYCMKVLNNVLFIVFRLGNSMWFRRFDLQLNLLTDNVKIIDCRFSGQMGSCHLDDSGILYYAYENQLYSYNVLTRAQIYQVSLLSYFAEQNYTNHYLNMSVVTDYIFILSQKIMFKANKSTGSIIKTYVLNDHNIGYQSSLGENFQIQTDNLDNVYLGVFSHSIRRMHLTKFDSNLNVIFNKKMDEDNKFIRYSLATHVFRLLNMNIDNAYNIYMIYTYNINIAILKLNKNGDPILQYDDTFTKDNVVLNNEHWDTGAVSYINGNFLYFFYRLRRNSTYLGGVDYLKYTITNLSPTVPSAPLNLAASPQSSTSIQLIWSPPASSGTIDGTIADTIESYTVTYIKNGENIIVNNASSPFTVTNLTGGTTYDFKVKAKNRSGMVGPDASVQGIISTVPNAPVITSADGYNGVATIVWTKPANGGATITGYTVTIGATEVNVNGENTLTTNVSGLTLQVVHTVTVKANNSQGSSAPSEEMKIYLFTFNKDSTILNSVKNSYGGYELKNVDNSLNTFKSLNNDELSVIQLRASAKATQAILNLTNNQIINLRRNLNGSLRSKIGTSNIVISSTNISKFLETFNSNYSADLNSASSIVYVPQQILRDSDGPVTELDVENISDYKAVEIPIDCKLILKSGETTVQLKFKGTYYEPWAGGTAINIGDTITVGSTRIKLFAVGSGIFGPSNDGGGGNGDPYVTTIHNKHYKLPSADIPIRFYQGMVGKKLLTVNANLRTVESNDLIGYNLHSFMELKNNIPRKTQQVVLNKLFNNQLLCFFEKVHISYGDSCVILDVWDGKFVVNAHSGDEIKSIVGTSTAPNKYTKEYKNYSNTTIALLCGSAKVFVSVYESKMVRNGIFVEAPNMELGNGVVVNTLSRSDMTLSSLASKDPVPNRDSVVKYHKETFIDARGMRVRTISHV
jgi:hypothetical protein